MGTDRPQSGYMPASDIFAEDDGDSPRVIVSVVQLDVGVSDIEVILVLM
mgnify:CR=1 FL=1